MRYNKELQTLKADDADNALYLGTALHTGIEKGIDAAIKEYFDQFPVITDLHINEAMKLEVMIPKAVEMLPQGMHEVLIEDADFKGFIDLLVPVGGVETFENTDFHGGKIICKYEGYDLYDFKYSNNVEHYKESVQIHLYKYFFEKLNPDKKIRNLYYLCVPKTQIRQKKTENLGRFRLRLQSELEKKEPVLIEVEYDQNKVIEWMLDVKHVLEATDFSKEQSWLCRFCEYKELCEKGIDVMILPKNERRNIEQVQKKVIWLYGQPFTGKTTFANFFPDPLMLNTDNNIKFVDAPYIAIKDKVEVTGRMTKRTMAWEMFKEVIAELEKKDNDFKTIVVDLLEDTYEHCRLYMYNQMGITHESDDSFRAWDKVRTEFLSTLKRLMALDYENIILISHEDTTKDITKKGGDKLTSIKPNLADKVANKVAGMVDIVARVIADGDVRTLSFKNNEVIFGGGRIKTNTNEIPLEYDAFVSVYNDANKLVGKVASNTTEKTLSDGYMSSDKEESEIATKDLYFYHHESESYWMVKKGDKIPKGIDYEMSVPISKEKYEIGIKNESAKTASTGETVDEKPKTRTRRKRD